MATISIQPGAISNLTNFIGATAIISPSQQTIVGASGLSSQTQVGFFGTAKTSGGMTVSVSSTGYITVPWSGTYYCSVHMYRSTAVSTSYDQEITIMINGTGSAMQNSQTLDANLQHMECSGLLWLSANDQISLYLGHTYTSSLTFNFGSAYQQSSLGNNIGTGWLALTYIGN